MPWSKGLLFYDMAQHFADSVKLASGGHDAEQPVESEYQAHHDEAPPAKAQQQQADHRRGELRLVGKQAGGRSGETITLAHEGPGRQHHQQQRGDQRPIEIAAAADPFAGGGSP